ncbi:hypothetical protein ACFL3T_00685 [Patescibacteria group bacterium]
MNVIRGPSMQEINAAVGKPRTLGFTDHFGTEWHFYISELHNHPTRSDRIVIFATLSGEEATLYYNPNARKGDGIVGCWELHSPIDD